MKFDRHLLILAASLVGLAGPGLAQDTPAPAPEAPAAEAPEPDATAPEAPAAELPATQPSAEGAAAAAAPEVGAASDGNPAGQEITDVLRDTFGDWQVRCFTQISECYMNQVAFDGDRNPVAEVRLVKLPEVAEAEAGVTVVSPLGTLLTSGVAVQIDGSEAGRHPFNWCNPAGCVSQFGLAGPSVAAMKRGKSGMLTLFSIAAPDSPIRLDLSLTGFTSAFDSLETPVPPGPAPAAALPSLAPKPAPTLAPAAPAN